MAGGTPADPAGSGLSAAGWTPTGLPPAELTPPDPQTARRTAAEGWIWGLPLVENYRTMYPQAVDDADPRYVGGFGVFRHHPQPFTPADTDVVTPNNDTPYSWAWLDLRAEPWVVEVPATDRYYVLPFHDLDTCYVGFVGTRSTGPQAGRYLVTGPAQAVAHPAEHGVPAGFDGVLRADSHLVGILGRSYLAGPEDVSGLRALQEQFRLRPLSAHLGAAPPPPAADPVWPLWREEARESVEFFAFLDFLLGFFPVLPADADLRHRLAELGIGSGDFEPAALPAAVRAAVRQGIADGRARLEREAAERVDSTGCFGTREQLGGDYLARAFGARHGLYGLPAEEAWYGGWVEDSAGNRRLDAHLQDYRLRFPPGRLPPARFFWSVTMYQLPERLLVANPIGRYSIGDRTPGLVYDADGGLTLSVCHQQPTDPARAANWLPAPDGPFSVVIRVYGPDTAVTDGSWTLPPLTPLS
ncbi:hypothetical protein P3T36_003247 [Kitasatospora sp. MAP12-15]|uniref:DUF1254 domain-containing protein n=1 Tax=unclassified Kitasatospora TaxID=2633591 RepID=UPI0024752614|nr:DUF1254 domain-containing protein [Kitasatospora sp. MAP12-44]MDH6111223.1 hypothetical protein [Kitasatospora sp. MAP12-44]